MQIPLKDCKGVSYFYLDWFSDDWSLRFCALASVGAFFVLGGCYGANS
jgi:hypothetical protein